MDFTLNERQLQLRSLIRGILAQQERPDKAGAPVFDAALMAALRSKGLYRKRAPGDDLLDAAMITEEVSQANRLAPVGLQLFLCAALFDQIPQEPIAIQYEGSRVPLRYAASASTLVILGDVEANAYRVDPAKAELAPSNYVYPLAYPAPASGKPIGTWPVAVVRRRWQLALAAEIVGAMSAALAQVVSYLSDRKQFGKRIGSFQAVQHRLAELAVSVECARLLVHEAAWRDDDALAASAACYAATAARQVCLDAHQLSGARGFTLEFKLYLSTLRLQALSLEGRGATQHGACAANEHWSVAMTQLLGCEAGNQSIQGGRTRRSEPSSHSPS
ncbi:MAG: hypothetical protein JWR16_1558 [Nevskia sp.]|nr:hypothetical protein [Nevskia sp.]